MNPAAVLALISDMYEQTAGMGREIARLQAENAAQQEVINALREEDVDHEQEFHATSDGKQQQSTDPAASGWSDPSPAAGAVQPV